MINNITIGSDIEIFLRDKVTKELKSAVGLIPGSKSDPCWVYKPEDGYATETDNVSVEFLIPICTNEDEFVKHISFMLEHISKIIPRELEIAIQSSGIFSNEQLDSEQARTMGCEGTFNAWKGRENKKPDGTKTNLRTNSFHIHIGYEDCDPVQNIELVKAMDLFIGIPSLLIDPDTERRKLYGKAGECRFKPYGVEVRVLGGYCIGTEELVRWTFKNTLAAIQFVNHFPNYRFKHDLESIINKNKLEEAVEVISAYNINIPATTIKQYAS